MSEKNSGFAETTKKDWAHVAQKELSGDNPLEKLAFRSGDLTLLPYYDDTDRPHNDERGHIRPAKSRVNAPRIHVADVATANRAALAHLQAGANGVLFDIGDTNPSAPLLLSGIELTYCSVFF